MAIEIVPTLHELGASKQFDNWRPFQVDAITRSMDSSKRFIALCMPTGTGKSIVAVGQAVLSGAKTIYLTSTKGLQNQLLHDFASIGLVDIRGQSNYPCIEYKRFDVPSSTTVDYAPCHAGLKCPSRESDCHYFKALRTAKDEQVRLVVTNYSYWILQNMFGGGLGSFDFMVCDEAHETVQEVCSVLSTTVHKFEVEAVLGSAFPPANGGLVRWKPWAGGLEKKLDYEIGTIKLKVQSLMDSGQTAEAGKEAKKLRDRKDLQRRLNVIASAKGDWVAEMQGTSMTWDPVWPQGYAEEILFLHVPKVMLTSATIMPKTLGLLGLNPTDYDFMEYPSTFHKSRRPVYRVPTVRLNKNSTDEDYRTWIQRMDQIIGPRLDRKGIAHTVSYKRRDYVMEHSEFREHMISHNSKNARAIVDAFKSAKAPCILVSPSMDTGYDFPGDLCRFMIVGKLPWPDTRAKVMAARKDMDPEYMSYLTMQTLVQMSGRGMRAEDDWCEVLVLDDSIGWFMKVNGGMAPKWFKEAIQWVSTIPEPLVV